MRQPCARQQLIELSLKAPQLYAKKGHVEGDTIGKWTMAGRRIWMAAFDPRQRLRSCLNCRCRWPNRRG